MNEESCAILEVILCLHVTIHQALNSVYTIQTIDIHEWALFISKELTGLCDLSCGVLGLQMIINI